MMNALPRQGRTSFPNCAGFEQETNYFCMLGVFDKPLMQKAF
jgi:hypothetical protein